MLALLAYVLFLLYLCARNQMKTVKTLHFDFVSVGVSLSVSFGYAYNWSLGNDPFVYNTLPTLMGEQQHITLLEGKHGMERHDHPMNCHW